MRRPGIFRLLREVVALSVGASALVACGGSIVLVDSGDASPEAVNPACHRIAPYGLPCGTDNTFSFSGTFDQCGGDNTTGIVPTALCVQYCAGTGHSSCQISTLPSATDPSGTNLLDCNDGPCIVNGRRPAGLDSPRGPRALDPVARHLAFAAHLEAASVDAFEHLAAELAAHGAPARIVSRARKAAREEVRHARTMTAIAAKAGATVERPRVATPGVRDLEAIATENAVEGCVNETFGAAVALVQAETAADPRVRAAMSAIARDEASHAQLAWDVARWADRRLDPTARERVRRGRDGAVRALLRRTDVPPDPRVVVALGFPPASRARRIAGDLAAQIWA